MLVSRVAARSLHNSAVSRMAQEAQEAGAEKVILTLTAVSLLNAAAVAAAGVCIRWRKLVDIICLKPCVVDWLIFRHCTSDPVKVQMIGRLRY